MVLILLFAFVAPNEIELLGPHEVFEHAKVALISSQKLRKLETSFCPTYLDS